MRSDVAETDEEGGVRVRERASECTLDREQPRRGQRAEALS